MQNARLDESQDGIKIAGKISTMSDMQTSLVAQSVKNLPAVQDSPVRSLGWEDPLEKEMAIHSSILAWNIL